MEKITCLLLIICFFITILIPQTIIAAENATSAKPKPEELYAKSAVLMDADSGRILYEKNGTEALANASTTKIMTCIIALETCDIDSEVEVTSRAASAPKVHLGMRTGQKFLLEDLLYGLMLESFNDCAIAIAEHIGGNVEAFSKIMNDKATEIGCKDTYFLTPNGLDAKDNNGNQHHTTAEDLALIMRYCIKESKQAGKFLEITRTAQYQIVECTAKQCYSCYNHNAFLTMMDGALTGKTGFTGNAGYCYVGALERDGKTYIVALLACGWPNNKSYKWSDTKKLMQYGIETYEKTNLEDISLDESKLKKIPVENGSGSLIGEKTYISFDLKQKFTTKGVLMKEGEKITVEYQIADHLTAPVEKNTLVGTITFSLDGVVLKQINAYANTAIQEINYQWCLIQTLKLAL